MNNEKPICALILGITMGVSLLGGCGKNTAITKDVYGQVTQTSENSITIETWGLGDTSSMPDLSGETQTITKTDGTIIKRQGMGGGSNDMNMPEGAEPPDMPEGTEPPEKPDGDNSVEETEITLSDISEGDVIFVEFGEDASVSEITVLSSGMGMGKRPVDAQAEVPDSYDAVVEYTSDTEATGKTLSSEGSTLTGAVTDDESYAGNGGDGYCRRMERLSGGEAVSIKVKDILYYFQSV